MKKSVFFLFLYTLAQAQTPAKLGWKLASEQTTAAAPLPGLRSNSVGDIVVHNGEVWLGTGSGLARSNDAGVTWVTYTQAQGLPHGGVSALAVTASIIWVATAFDSLVPEGLLRQEEDCA